MPRERTNRRTLTRPGFNQNYFAMDCRIVFCKCCQRQNHTIHPEATTIHQRNVLTNGPDTFYMELCQTMVAANIPWYKLQSPQLRAFLEKHCRRVIPYESALRRQYLNECYESILNKIRYDVGNSYIWVAVTETTDVKGRYVANLTLGRLSGSNATSPHLLAVKFLDKSDQSSNQAIANFIHDSLSILWPTGVQYERVLLLYTNPEEYMIKAATSLKNFYPNLIHVTCLLEALNSVCELIRSEYDVVGQLISNVKKVFVEAPIRILKFRNNHPNLSLPPQGIVSSYNWLKAALYYQKNFEAIKQVVMKFDPEVSETVNTAQKCLNNKDIKNNLIYIGSNFRTLSKAVKELKSGNHLNESVSAIENVKKSLNKAPGCVAQKAFQKFEIQLNNNSGFNILRTVSDILCGKNEPELPQNITCETAVLLKYAPVMCCDVEHCFPNFRALLSDKRLMSLACEDVEKIVILYTNTKSEAE